jgi:SPP1 gp7 family putative phage head morphogenesis protein
MKNPPLTKKRKSWARRHNPDVIKGSPLQYNYAIQARYSKALVALVKQMTQQAQRELIKNLQKPDAKEYFALDESVASSSRILTNALRKKFTQLFSEKSRGLAESMFNQTEKASTSALHESLKQLSGGLSLGTRVFTAPMDEIMKATIAENVSLIRSIPEKYFTDIEGAVMRSITTGNGLKDLVPFMRNHEGITVRRARLIAGDQSRKAYSNITAAKMKALDTDKYIWVHSAAAQEPRELHKQLNGKICSLTDPPVIQQAKGSQPEIRGKPGDLINCLCIMRPVIDFSGK